MTAATSGQAQGDHGKSVLHRKARAGRVEHQTRAMSVPKALRVTLAKVADDLCNMAMAAIGVRVEQRRGDALGDLFDDASLLMSLDGPLGSRAAAVFDAALVGGLIQQQTMGKVMPELDGAVRRMTTTDAAICAPFLDTLLQRAALLPETEDERALLQGYRFGSRPDDARLLHMTLEAAEYQVVYITVDIAGGQRQGQIVLCMPSIVQIAEKTRGTGGDARTGDGVLPRRKKWLNETVLGLHIDLNIALARLSMPLNAVSALAVGDTLNLGVTAFDKSRVLTMDGCNVGRGTLGQIGGVRALRVEHQKTAATPKRRASDRVGLDLPDVAGDGTGTQTSDIRASGAMAQTNGIDGMPDMPDLAKLPDMSDLPGFDDDNNIDDLSAIPRAEAG